MNISALRRLVLALAGLLAIGCGTPAAAEPPSRAARLAYAGGTVSFSPAGESDWVQAAVNRPLTTGDRLWADADARAELQIGGTAIRLGPGTSVTLLDLDDRIAQLQLSQGTLIVHVRRMGPDQSVEVDTPNLALTLRHAGDYRIDVDGGDDATAVTVRGGEAEAYGEGASYVLQRGQGYRFYGVGLSDYDRLETPRRDDLDRWASDRDRRADASPSARYVSPDVIGYEDLDANGTWRDDPTYGHVWTPTRVASGWTPYRDGHWAWIDPWGWTWVDDAPWGFAVSHYGRWAHIDGSWGWVPGPRQVQAVYAPALVAFVGGRNFQLSVTVGAAAAAAVAWFPLAPRDVYQPSYPVSRGYFDNINRSNAAIAPATINNVYNTVNVTNNTTIVNNTTNVTRIVYANQQVTGAVVAVPTQAFVQSRPVARAVVPLSRQAALEAPVVAVAAVAPVQQSLHGGAPVANAKPPLRQQAVVARTAPPPPPIPFAAQRQELAARPGKPIDETQRKQLKPVVAAAPPVKISVVAPAHVAAPTAPPPASAPAPRSPQARRVAPVLPQAASEAPKAQAAPPLPARQGPPATPPARGALPPQAPQGPQPAHAPDPAPPPQLREPPQPPRSSEVQDPSARSGAGRAAAARAEAAKADAAKAGAAKAETAKAEAAKGEAAKGEAARSHAVQADAARAAKADAAASANAARAEAARAAAARAEAGRAAAAQAAAARAEQARQRAARPEPARAASARAAASAPAAATPASTPNHPPDGAPEDKRQRGNEDARQR